MSENPHAATVAQGEGIKASAEVSLMYLQTGFIECPQCGEEVPTKDLDAAYELATVVQPAPTIGGTARTYPVPEGMKPWAGGDGAPDDWDGGSVLRADGQTEHSDDITIQQWKHPVPRCKWNVVAYTPARVLKLPEPVFATKQAVKWRERWYGSEPQKGSAIVDERGNLIAYFGGDETTHKATTAAVSAHNASIAAQPATSQEGQIVDRLSDDETARANAMLDLFAPLSISSTWEPSERRTIVRAMLAYGDAVAGITNTIRDAADAVSFWSMDEWDQRDEIVMLLVDYREGEHSLDDAVVAITVGHNNDHNVGEGEGSGWQFAGWLWSQDCYTQGEGKPIGWLPLSEYHEYARGVEKRLEAA